ncbi:proteasome regulatory particle lid subunit RPN7 PWA37_000209 [Arxiozyma heterogenica]|uniref:proteasome regulatory particle lid subunit RPN7 n=1 Tax=Arxiozyma heterogenica TaxID=278026 RepID=UPI002F06B90A
MTRQESDSEEENVIQEPEVLMVPNFVVSDKTFLLSLYQNDKNDNVDNTKKLALIQEIIDLIDKDEMGPFYKYITTELGLFPFDQNKYEDLIKLNEKKLKELNENIQTLEKNDEGALELSISWNKLGAYYTQIGDFENAKHILLGKAFETAISIGAKIDILLMIVRLGFFYDDKNFIKEKLQEIESLIEKGGDWERRNRYKTYMGIYSLSVREFNKAAELLVDSLATFTSVELTSYENIAMYASVAGLFALERTDLKTKIIDSPELLSIMTSTPALQSITSLTISLYTSEYSSFFPYLLETYENVLIPSKYLNKHANYFIREMRRKCYAQLLDSYKTLSLQSMANSFGVSVDFLDDDLSKFIPNKKLNCIIDRVNGIVETNRPDNKNSQYQLLIKNGDSLLTKLQKYSAAVKLTGEDRVV